MSPLLCLFLLNHAPVEHPVLRLWPNGAPGSEARRNEAETKPHPWSIANIQNPSLVVYVPEHPNGTSVVIAPGGGFRELVVGAEGDTPAQYLSNLGITAFMLKYRLFREDGSNLNYDRDARADAFRATRLVRSLASTYGLDPKRVGYLGFSAGGEIVSAAVFGPAPMAPANPDPVDLQDGKPNFAMWIYPGPLGIPAQVAADAPPAFLLTADDDDHTNAVMDLAKKYRDAKVSLELHILSGGGHGFNMGDRSSLQAVKTWPQRLADWLSDRGYLKPASK